MPRSFYSPLLTRAFTPQASGWKQANATSTVYVGGVGRGRVGAMSYRNDLEDGGKTQLVVWGCSLGTTSLLEEGGRWKMKTRFLTQRN